MELAIRCAISVNKIAQAARSVSPQLLSLKLQCRPRCAAHARISSRELSSVWASGGTGNSFSVLRLPNIYLSITLGTLKKVPSESGAFFHETSVGSDFA